jgi:hypothetical protein
MFGVKFAPENTTCPPVVYAVFGLMEETVIDSDTVEPPLQPVKEVKARIVNKQRVTPR